MTAKFNATILSYAIVFAAACGGGGNGDYGSAGLDGFPPVAEHDFIELGKVERISRFRSGVGGDRSDDFESCRNMTNRYGIAPEFETGSVEIFSPIDGAIETVTPLDGGEPDLTGNAVTIRSDAHPALRFEIRPVDLLSNEFRVGQQVKSGMQIGHLGVAENGGAAATAVIAVEAETEEGTRLLPYSRFWAYNVLENYQLLGVESAESLIIEREDRDADPLECVDGEFADGGNLDNWVMLSQ